MEKIISCIIWLIGFLVIGVLFVGVGMNYEEASYQGMIIMYMIGFLLGSVISLYIKERFELKNKLNPVKE